MAASIADADARQEESEEALVMKAVSHVNNEFRQHASPESIRYHLRRAQANRDRWQREVNQLEELLAERLGQIERGEWPPAPRHPQPEGQPHVGGH